MKRILCAWFPNWPIQRLQAAQPELNGRPVVLFAEVPGRGQRVMYCSDSAAAGGVRLGDPLASAASLKFAADRLSRQPHQPDADRAALESLAQTSQRFSPVVGLEDAEYPSSLLLNITGLARLFHSETRLTRQLLAHCRRMHYRARIAVADTVGAAWAAAHWATDAEQPSRILPGGETGQLLALPVPALRIDDATAALLQQLGFSHIGQLLRIDRASLAVRFGEQLLRRLDQLWGQVDEPIQALATSAELVANWELEYPEDRIEAIEQLLTLLLAQLTDRLRQQDCGAVQLVCRMRGEQGQRCELPVYLFEPVIELGETLGLFQLQWQRHGLPPAVISVAVEVTATAPRMPRQHELFARPRDNPQAWAALLQILSNRLGPQHVVRTLLRADPQPEHAFRTGPWVGSAARRPRRGRALPAEPGQRPLALLPSPEPIDVAADNTTPVAFTLDSQHYQVTHAWGPERIQTGWWRGRSIQRDYYRVETTTGNRFWIFRRLGDGRWFWHGEFE